MQPAEARRSERIRYRGVVELLALGDAIEPRCVRAEAVDLGAGGLGLVAQAQMAVGSTVTCKLDLDGRPAALPGRVAWARRGDGAHGIGVCFGALSEYDSALLRHMVERSRDGYRAVELRFASLRQPIFARARRCTNGLRLSAPLPIFARGSELSFRLDAEGPLLTGHVSDAALREDEHSRRIEIDVDVAAPEGVRFRRNARYGFPSEIARAESSSAQPRPPRRAGAAPAPHAPRPERRTSATQAIALLPLALSIALGATVGYAAAAVEAHPAQVRTTTRSPVLPAPAATPARPAAEPAQALAQSPKGGVTAAATHASAQVTEAPAQIAPSALPARPFLFAPEVRAAGTRTIVRFPVDGTLEQMRVLRWAAPLALNLYLPNARVPLSKGLYRSRKGSVRSIAIKPEGGEQLVRLRLTAPPARYALHLDSGMLELSLEHD